MSFAPLFVPGGGLAQCMDVNASGWVIIGADTQGIYRSKSAPAGNDWLVRNKGIGASTNYRQVAAILWSLREANTIYAAVGDSSSSTGGGLLVSASNGDSWALRTNVPQFAGNHAGKNDPVPQSNTRPAGRLLVQDAGSDWLFAGTYNQGILRSANNGLDGFPVACQMAGAAPGSTYFVVGMAQQPGTPTTLYACAYDTSGTTASPKGYLWKCTNAHATTPNFNTKLTSLPSFTPEEVWVATSGNVYVACGNDGVFVSKDGGTTWTSLNGGTPTVSGGGLDVSAGNSWWDSLDGYTDGSGNDQVLVSCANPIKPSGATGYSCVVQLTIPSTFPTSGSVTWAQLTTTLSSIQLTSIPPTGRTNWNTGGLLLGKQGWTNPTVRWDQTDGTHQRIYVAGTSGFYRSVNGGSTWTIANDGMPQFLAHALACSPVRAQVEFGDSDWGLFHDLAPAAEQGGTTLQNEAPENSTQGFSCAFSADGSLVYGANGNKYTNSGGGVWSRPYNSPGSWTELGFRTATGGKVAIGMAAFNDAAGHPIVCCVVWNSGLWRYEPTGTGGAYRWVNRTSSIGTTTNPKGGIPGTSLPIVKGAGGLVYVFDRLKGIWRSNDYGQTWTLIWTVSSSDPDAATLAADPTRSARLWVATSTGLYHLEGADTGTVSGGGITGAGSPVASLPGKCGPVACDPSGNVIVALQDQGNGSALVRSTDSGAHWSDIVGDSSFAECNCNPETIVVSPFDGRVYVSGSNVVASGFPSSGSGQGASAPFTERQDSGTLASPGTTGALQMWFSQAGGMASAVGSMLSARLTLADNTAVVTPPNANWVLAHDEQASAGTSIRVQTWHYLNNPGGLGGPAQANLIVPAGLRRAAAQTHAASAYAAAQVNLGGTGAHHARPVTSTAWAPGEPSLIPGGPVAPSDIVFTNNTGVVMKGRLTEYTTPAGTVQVFDQHGGTHLVGSATSLGPVTASAPNTYSGGLGLAFFGAALTSPAGQSWSTPGSWTSDGVANNAATVYSAYYETNLPAGTTSVTGSITLGTSTMTAWAGSVCTYYAVATSAVQITTPSLPAATSGIAYPATQLQATGGATPYTWAVTLGALPPSLSLAAGGLLTGTPTGAGGSYAFGVTVTDAAGQTATAAYTIVEAGPLTMVTTSPLPGALTGVAYTDTLQATGGAPNYAWAVTAGALPPGMALTGTGVLSGLPLLPGVYTFTVQATDQALSTVSLACSLTVTSGPLAVTTTVLAYATIGASYAASLAAAGGTPPYTWVISAGSLPPGLTLDSSGHIGGTPTQGGQYTFTAEVTDAVNAHAFASFTITVYLVIVPPAPKGPWRILFGSTQPNWSAQGQIIQAQSRVVTIRTDPTQNDQIDLDIDGRSAAALGIIELETDLAVLFGDQTVMVGRVVPTNDALQGDAHRLTMSALDYRAVLRRRAVLPGDTLSWTNKEQALIAWQLLNATQGRPGGNLGITRGVGQSTGITRTYTATLGDWIGDDITTLAGLNGGFEWQITPYTLTDLRLDIFYPFQGNDNGVVLTLGDGKVSNIQRAVDPTTFGDAVYVTGNSTNSLTAVHLEASDIATRAEGRWDLVIGTQDNTQSTLNDDAAGLLNQGQVVVPSYTIQLYPGAWDGPDWLWRGDYVTVRIDDGRLQVNDKLRVVEMAFDIGNDGVEVLTLTVGMIPFRVNQKIATILKRLRYLETR